MSADWHSHALGFELLEVKKKTYFSGGRDYREIRI